MAELKTKVNKASVTKERGGCLYINKLADINKKELEKIIRLAERRKK